MVGKETNSHEVVDSLLLIIVEPYFVQVSKFSKLTIDLVDLKCDAIFMNGIVLGPVRPVDLPIVTEDDDSLMIVSKEVVVVGGNNNSFIPVRVKKSSSRPKVWNSALRGTNIVNFTMMGVKLTFHWFSSEFGSLYLSEIHTHFYSAWGPIKLWK